MVENIISISAQRKEHWDRLRGDQGFYWDDGLFRPSTDTFLLGSFPVLRRGERACDLGAGTGLLGALLLGVGMCLCMVFDKMIPGVIIGLVGILALLMLIPMTKGIHD